jgi:hypothetical protein
VAEFFLLATCNGLVSMGYLIQYQVHLLFILLHANNLLPVPVKGGDIKYAILNFNTCL